MTVHNHESLCAGGLYWFHGDFLIRQVDQMSDEMFFSHQSVVVYPEQQQQSKRRILLGFMSVQTSQTSQTMTCFIVFVATLRQSYVVVFFIK